MKYGSRQSCAEKLNVDGSAVARVLGSEFGSAGEDEKLSEVRVGSQFVKSGLAECAHGTDLDGRLPTQEQALIAPWISANDELTI